MLRLSLVALSIALSVVPAAAQSNSDSAEAFAQMLASEKACGLTYDQAAIRAWIDKHVAADDMTFTQLLDSYVQTDAYALGQMSLSQKTAHCEQIIRVARASGFTT